jgi:hypothetical protein
LSVTAVATIDSKSKRRKARPALELSGVTGGMNIVGEFPTPIMERVFHLNWEIDDRGGSHARTKPSQADL